jgi:hypothetical protein
MKYLLNSKHVKVTFHTICDWGVQCLTILCCISCTFVHWKFLYTILYCNFLIQKLWIKRPLWTFEIAKVWVRLCLPLEFVSDDSINEIVHAVTLPRKTLETSCQSCCCYYDRSTWGKLFAWQIQNKCDWECCCSS